MPVGRPTLYRPEYCEMIQDFMAKGYSLGAFAGSIGVGRTTLDKWKAAHPEFADAWEIGQAKAQMKWEQRMADVADGKNDARGAPVLVTFALRNMGRKDFPDTKTIAGDPEAPIKHEHRLDTSKLSTETLRELMAARDATSAE